MKWNTENPKEPIYAIVSEKSGYVEAAYFTSTGVWLTCDTYESDEIYDVTAWIPMPKPYDPDKGKEVRWE